MSTESIKYIGLFILLVFLRQLTGKKDVDSRLIQFDAQGLKHLGTGAAAGFTYVAGYCLIVIVTGKGHISFAGLNAFATTIVTATSLLLVIIPEALFGEYLFRGFILEQLSHRYSSLAAISVTSGLNAALSGLLSISSPYLWLIMINSFILSIILCLITAESGSLMPGLGKEIAFGLTQGLLFSIEHSGVRSAASLAVDGSIMSGIPGNICSSFAFALVLIIGLVYELRHLKK